MDNWIPIPFLTEISHMKINVCRPMQFHDFMLFVVFYLFMVRSHNAGGNLGVDQAKLDLNLAGQKWLGLSHNFLVYQANKPLIN